MWVSTERCFIKGWMKQNNNPYGALHRGLLHKVNDGLLMGLDVYFVENYTIQKYLTQGRINHLFHKHFDINIWEPTGERVFAFQISLFDVKTIKELSYILPDQKLPSYLNHMIFCEDFKNFDVESFGNFIKNALKNSPQDYNAIIFTRLLK